MSGTPPPVFGTAFHLSGLLVLFIAMIVDGLTLESPKLYFISAIFFLIGHLLMPQEKQ